MADSIIVQPDTEGDAAKKKLRTEVLARMRQLDPEFPIAPGGFTAADMISLIEDAEGEL